MTPKLSILTPVWNQEELVIKGLDSIPRRDDIEVIVRDDGSHPNYYDLVCILLLDLRCRNMKSVL